MDRTLIIYKIKALGNTKGIANTFRKKRLVIYLYCVIFVATTISVLCI